MTSSVPAVQQTMSIEQVQGIGRQIAESMDSGSIGLGNLVTVHVPAGGTRTWEIPNIEGGDVITVPVIRGVLVGQFPTRVNWHKRLSGEGGQPPDCVSSNMEEGIGRPTPSMPHGVYACATCPANAWGSARDQTGNPTKGKQCKEVLHLLLLTEETGYAPLHLRLGLSALKAAQAFFFGLLSKPPADGSGSIWIEIGLEQREMGGNKVSVPRFRRGEEAPEHLVALASLYREHRIVDSLRASMMRAPESTEEVSWDE